MMSHTRIVSRADEHAKRDFLTGAWTRRALFEFVDLEMRRAWRSNRPLSLLLLDIDYFKSINDTLGHAGGDQVLVDMVTRAESVLRNVDYFARIGGEEFAVLLPDADKAVALAVAERLRLAIGLHDHAAASHGLPPYTVSIGVAMLRTGENFSALMHRADMALYAAKAGGRNRVAGAHSESAAESSENTAESGEALAHC
jgi:diguanylate cyclase (GGDEF)-like protein